MKIMQFIRLFPSSLFLVLSLLMGFSLFCVTYFKKGPQTLLRHKDWLVFNFVLIVILLERFFRPGIQLTLNFVIPGLLALIWLVRIVDLDKKDQESVQNRIMMKLPFLVALIIITITNHVSELFGLITLCVSFLVIQIVTYKKENLLSWKSVADISLILTIVLSYNFGEHRNIFWLLTFVFQLGMFLDSRDGSHIEA